MFVVAVPLHKMLDTENMPQGTTVNAKVVQFLLSINTKQEYASNQQQYLQQSNQCRPKTLSAPLQSYKSSGQRTVKVGMLPSNINIILDQTHKHLLKLLKEDQTGRIVPVLAVYPCLEDCRHVSIQFFSKIYSVRFSSTC